MQAPDPNSNLANSIAMLEQILEVMPEDAVSLRALYNAYGKAGNRPRAFEYLNRLVAIAANQGGGEILEFVQEELGSFEDDFPSEVAAQKARLRTIYNKGGSGGGSGASRTAASGAAKDRKVELDIGEEIALAWRLYEESQLSQEEYSSVLHDLTEVSSKELDVPVSVLHVLNDRGFTQMNRIINYLSSRSGVPCLELSQFELTDKLAGVVPADIPVHEGALPFAFFGNDLLMAVLNPFNGALVEKAEAASGHRCHTYLVAPEDYDRALSRWRALAA